MKIRIMETSYTYNFARREKVPHDVVIGDTVIDDKDLLEAMRKAAYEYRISYAELVKLCLRYYFGDGKNHLVCEWCGYYDDLSRNLDGNPPGCNFPAQGEQTTVPLLDKGTVVVG